MNAAFRGWALFLFQGRRSRIFAVRLWWHVQEPPHDALHAAADLSIGQLVVIILHTRKLMRKRHTPQDMDLILAELAGENDRSTIVVGGSLAEHALEQLLASKLREPKNKTEAGYLFSDTGILGTFWEKIWAAYFMALVGPAVRRELDLIRLIRNEVAHNMNQISFSVPEIGNRCRELTLFAKFITEPDNLRMRFLVTVQILSAALLWKSLEDQSPGVKEAMEKAGLQEYLRA